MNFRRLYNHCGNGGLKSEDVEKNSILSLEKRPLQEYFQNSVPKGFIDTAIDVLCSNFVKFGRRQIGKNRALFTYLTTKKHMFARLSGTRYCAARAAARASSQRQCTRGVVQNPDFIQTGSLSAELYPNA